MPPRFIAEQLSHPSGIFAPIIGFLMNRHNRRMNAFAVTCLDAQSGDRLLEVGFGGGLTLHPLIERAGHYCGLDRSRDVVALASKRYAKAVADGRAEFQQGAIEDMPFPAATFDKVMTVNTVYFWTSLEAGFRQLHRVLVPGGRAVIGFLPKEHMDRMKMPTDIFTTRYLEDVRAAMIGAGFVDLESKRPQAETAWTVVVARRG